MGFMEVIEMDEVLLKLESKIEELMEKVRMYKDRCESLERENQELREKLSVVQEKVETLLNKIKDLEE
jgi:FtsZ-binding cell division protein ZapB